MVPGATFDCYASSWMSGAFWDSASLLLGMSGAFWDSASLSLRIRGLPLIAMPRLGLWGRVAVFLFTVLR